MPLSDQAFLDQFENLSLDENQFKHAGHLRLAWLYLNQYPLDIAIKKTTRGIQAYANSHGDFDKFNHSMTEAIVKIIHSRLQKTETSRLAAFLDNNPDLSKNTHKLLCTYYSQDLLNSQKAKQEFIPPDLKKLPE